MTTFVTNASIQPPGLKMRPVIFSLTPPWVTTTSCLNLTRMLASKALLASFNIVQFSRPLTDQIRFQYAMTVASEHYIANTIFVQGVSLYGVSTSFPTAHGGTHLAAVAEDTKHPLRNVLDQPSPLAPLPFHHYNPQAENSGKDKTRRSCTSCYNRRKVNTLSNRYRAALMSSFSVHNRGRSALLQVLRQQVNILQRTYIYSTPS